MEYICPRAPRGFVRTKPIQSFTSCYNALAGSGLQDE
jgi:hypothetical protein